MSNVLNSQIGLDIKVNQPQTGGLDVTLAQLREIKAELKGLGQAWRAGMQPPAAAMLGKEDWAKSFKQQFGKRSTFSMGDIEKVVTERMRMQGQSIDAAMQTSIRDGLLRAVATRPRGHQWQHAISGKIGRDSAAALIARWGEMEQAFTKAAFDSLTTGLRAGKGAAPVGGKVTAASGAVSATLGNGSIPLVIDPSRIQVSLGAGNVTFTLGANQVQGVAAATAGGAKAATASTAAGATPAPGASAIPAPGPRAQAPGTLVKTVTTDTGTNRAGSMRVTEYRLDSTGRLIETTTGGRSTKTKTTDALYEPFNDPAQFRKYFQGRMSTAANPAARLAELDRALGMITQKQSAGQWMGGPWAEIADSFGGRRAKYVADRDKAAQREQAQADRVSAEASRVAAARQSTRIRDLHQLQGGQLSVAEALALRQMATEQGYAADSERFGTQGRGRNRVLRKSTTYRKRDTDGTSRAFTVGLEYDPSEVARAGGDTSGLTPIRGTTSGSKRSAKPTDAGDGRYSGKYKDLITNTQNVTAWASSVWVLYGALNAARQSLTTLIETGYETARLEQVFSGVGGTTLDLRDNVLALAAANGRSTEEALSAAVAWSRLGLTFDQVGEAVRVSMMAANVAELSTADATKYLQAVMAAYRLEVSQLSTVLGEMNEISNNWNVTNADLMTGLARTASVAKQAGMPLAELMGVIGAAVGFTGQSGANIGNSLKSLTVALSNPEIQKFLKQDFGINVREGDTGEFRGLSTVLQELFVRYQELTDAERQYLLVRVAGKTQASRVAATMDSYIQGQLLAINAQLDINSAQEENAKILDTLKAGLQGVVTEYGRLIALQAQGGKGGQRFREQYGFGIGPEDAMKGGLTGMRNVLALFNTSAGSTALAGMLALVTALAARFALVAVQAKIAYAAAARVGDVGRMNSIRGGAGMLSNTLRRAQEFGGWAGDTARGIVRDATGSDPSKWTGRFVGLRTAVAAAGVSLAQMLPVMALAAGATWVFNSAMEALGFSSSKAEGRIDKLNQALERHREASAGASQAAQLYETVGRSLYKMDDRKRIDTARTLGRMAGGMGLTEEERKMVEDGGEGAGALLARKSKQASDMAFRSNVAATIAAELKAEAATNEANRLEKLGRHKSAEAMRQQAQGLAGQAIRLSEEEEEALRPQFDNDPHKARLNLRGALLSNMGSLFDSLPAGTSIDAAANRSAGIRSMLGLVADQRAQLEGELKQASTADAENTARRKDILKQQNELKKSLGPVWSGFVTAGPIAVDSGQDTERKQNIKDQIEALELEARSLGTGDATKEAGLRDQLNKLSAKETELRGELGGAQAEETAAGIRQRIDLVTADVGGRLNAATVGENQTVALLNRRHAILQQIQEVEMDLSIAVAGTNDREEGLVRKLTLQAELKKTLIELTGQQHELSKAEAELQLRSQRELREQSLMGGPRDMLRQLGAQRLAFDGRGQGRSIGLGEWLSWSPDLRRQVGLMRPELSAEGRELATARRALGAGFDPAQARSAILAGADEGTRNGLGNEWRAAMAAATSLSQMNAAVLNTTLALDAFKARLDAVLPGPGFILTDSPPANAQSAPGRY